MDGRPLMVWPSNGTLAARAGSMPERSLRRHLERLVDAGLIRRHASSNGKRYALRHRSQVVDAYGFDLAPLFREAGAIALAAQEAIELEEQKYSVRLRILNTLAQLRAAHAHSEDEAGIKSLLRRKLSLETLEDLLQSLHSDEVKMAEPSQETIILTASNGQNGRHLQKPKYESFDSVSDSDDAQIYDQVTYQPSTDEVLQLKETLELSPTPILNPTDLVRFSEKMAPMIGISPQSLSKAKASMGEVVSALTVLCLVQISPNLRSPAAYLHALVERAGKSKFSLSGLLQYAGRQAKSPMNL